MSYSIVFQNILFYIYIFTIASQESESVSKLSCKFIVDSDHMIISKYCMRRLCSYFEFALVYLIMHGINF